MEKSKNKFYIRTYGCQMNKYDSEVIKNLLLKLNFREVSSPEEADYVFLNTCAVREHAEKRVFGRLDSLKGLKRVKPDTVIGVLGCVAKYHPELIGHPVVDFLAPPDSYRNLIQWLKTKRKGTIPENENEEYSDIFISPNKISSYLSITRGCNYFCSYCVVPYTRGRIRSRPPEDILEEAQSLVNSGTKEIILLGQNINAYHYNGIDFPEILKRVSSIKGVKRLGFLTSHPGDLPKELFSVMAAFDNITNYLHLPLQSGSDKILTRMNRGYKLKDYMKIIEEARNLMPDSNLTTDIIVGFPGEKEEDFQKTLDAMKRIRFDQAYMFAYSNRKGTLSALFPNQVEKKVRKQRLQRLIYTQNEITREKARELIGKEREVLILGEGKKGCKLGKDRNGRIIMTDGVAKIGTEYIIKINKVNGWVPFGGIKKEA